MAGNGKPHWSKADTKLMVKLRDLDGLSWEEMAPHFPGRTAAACMTRYRYVSHQARAAATRPQEVRPEPAETISSPTRPRYFHNAHTDMLARIERQGVTAGVFGDPPPGRSALDERMSGRAAPVAPRTQGVKTAPPRVTLATQPMRVE